MTTKEEKISKLTEELLELLKEGNITIEELIKDPDFLVTHPDFDKAIDILASIEDLLCSGQI